MLGIHSYINLNAPKHWFTDSFSDGLFTHVKDDKSEESQLFLPAQLPSARNTNVKSYTKQIGVLDTLGGLLTVMFHKDW